MTSGQRSGFLTRALTALVVLLSAQSALAQSISAPPFTPYVYTPIASDLNPAIHLSNLMGKTSATICAIGDSTMTTGPVAGNAVDESQAIWGFLQDKLKADNPKITSWAWGNYAIGGSNENQPLQTFLVSGLTPPSWVSDTSLTWASYIQTHALTTNACDVLFYLFGTNQASAGAGGTTSAATFISNNLANFDGWAKVPNIIMISNKVANPPNDTSGDDTRQAFHMAQAAFHRSFARSNGAGYTTFPNIQALGIGLIDLGRYFATRVQGYDPAAQYMSAVSASIVNGFNIIAGTLNTVDATTVGTTTDGDYRLTFVLPAEGGTTIGGSGGTALKISAGGFTGNYVRINIGGTGTLVPKYLTDGNIAAAPTQTGSSVVTGNGNDVVITVSLSGKRIQVWIAAGSPGFCATGSGADQCSGTLALDIAGARFYGGPVGGSPVNLIFASSPGTPMTANITQFYQGTGTVTTPLMTPAQAFGNTLACTAANNGCQGGNTQNHQVGSSSAIDREAINAVNLAVPASLPYGPIYISGNYYATLGVDSVAGTPAAPGINTAVCNAFLIGGTNPVTVQALEAAITTASNLQHFQLAIYANGSWGRPSTLLASTPDISTTSTGAQRGTVTAVALAPAQYWMCENTDTAAVIFRSLGAGSLRVASMIGTTTTSEAVGTANIQGISVAQTYGTWPSFVSGTAWADVVAASVAVTAFQVQ